MIHFWPGRTWGLTPLRQPARPPRSVAGEPQVPPPPKRVFRLAAALCSAFSAFSVFGGAAPLHWIFGLYGFIAFFLHFLPYLGINQLFQIFLVWIFLLSFTLFNFWSSQGCYPMDIPLDPTHGNTGIHSVSRRAYLPITLAPPSSVSHRSVLDHQGQALGLSY